MHLWLWEMFRLLHHNYRYLMVSIFRYRASLSFFLAQNLGMHDFTLKFTKRGQGSLDGSLDRRKTYNQSTTVSTTRRKWREMCLIESQRVKT